MKYIAIIACLLFSSCAQLSIDAKTGLINYIRFGDQQFQGLDITKDGDKIRVKIERQQASGAALEEALGIIKSLTGDIL